LKLTGKERKLKAERRRNIGASSGAESREEAGGIKFRSEECGVQRKEKELQAQS